MRQAYLQILPELLCYWKSLSLRKIVQHLEPCFWNLFRDDINKHLSGFYLSSLMGKNLQSVLL